MQRGGDRPERQNVWVRGGPPSYYTPAHPQPRPAVVPEAHAENVRRGSTGSSASVSSTTEGPLTPTSSPTGTSLPAFPVSPISEAPERQKQSSEARGERSFSQSQPALSPPSNIIRPDLAPLSPGRNNGLGFGQKPRTRSGSYAALMSQKRNSGDEAMNRRKQSWREMLPGSDPSRQQLWQRWWDGFTRGKPSTGSE
ncbi:hypothetical protein VTO42DRAFT_3855 [Malbranchea cinnamomea]